MESCIIFEDLLNKFWVIKSIDYCWKKVGQNEWFFFCSRVICSFGFK